jgi:hypothetical protein
MTKDEALRLALEALEDIGDEWGFTSQRTVPKRKEAITAIKAALEAKDEPVGTVKELFTQAAWERLDLKGSTEVYTTPPQRTWVGLDEEDYIKAYELCDFDKDAAFEFFEAKLKAKNETN